MLQILWGIVKQANIDYVERIWEEFVQSIHTFIEDKRNLSRHTTGKKRATLIVILSIRFTKPIIHHLQRRHKFHPRPDSSLHLPNEESVLGYLKFSAKGTKREVFGMPIPGSLITAEIQEASYYREYLAKVAQHQRYLASETGVIRSLLHQSPLSPPGSPRQQYPRHLQDLQSLLQLHQHNLHPHQLQPNHRKRSASRPQKHLTSLPKRRNPNMAWGPLPPVVIREPESGKYQPLPEVPGKGKAKVTEEQFAHDLLSLQKYKKTSPVDQYIFQRRVSKRTGSSGHDESPYALLGQSDSEEDLEKVVLGADEGGQDEGQARPNPGAQAEDQTGSNADAQDKGQAGSNPDETSEGQARPNTGDAGAKVQSIPSPMVHAGSDREHMDLDVADGSPQPSTEQLDECDRPSDADKNAETKVESMVNVLIQQAMSSISLMTSPIIDLTSRPESPKVHQQFKAITTDTTTTTITLPPQAQQQSTVETMMVKRIGELEHIMANLIQVNKDMEERLDKHVVRLYTLEQLDIPQQVSIVVSEVVTDAVDWAMQAPLRNRFKDLSEADMKEILHQRMPENQILQKKSRESPKTPPGSPSHQPPPPPPPVGPSRALGAPEASGSSQVLPSPPPPLSTNQESLSKGSVAPSLSKTAASTEYQAWTTTDIRLRSSISLTPAYLEMDDDMAPDEQAQLSDDEDIGTLASNYSPPPKDSLLAQTGDIATFMDWFCKRRGITELKHLDLEGPAYEIIKVFHPDVIHLQYQMKECHKLLTDSMDDPILRHNISKPLPLGSPFGQVTIQSDFFFNKDLEYLRYGNKGRRPALSIWKMKAAYYPDDGLEQMVPDQFWINEECKYDIVAMYGISYWWFQIQRFHIDRHTSEGDRRAVRTHI
uniref:E-beta-farnesene synthase n=1 Tax=Tanacetum cinerariifolium TaxID=118510 RepID=A0A699IXQ8_TANCI|nr:E-beta-farnesene synthase [Tanacetum cinerariifolium]